MTIGGAHAQVPDGVRSSFAYGTTHMLDVVVFIRASGAGAADVRWRRETGWVGPLWEWIGAQS